MQGILFFVVALFALTHAQANDNGKGNGNDAGGCCFYSDKAYQNVVVCTSEEFNIPARANIQSFFCTERFSAAILDGNTIQELAGCGDALDASLLPIPATKISVGPCSPERRCCFYTGVNKDGDEFCLNDPAATPEELRNAQANAKFRVAECTGAYRATFVEKGGKRTEVGCGVTHDIAANTEITAVTMTPCPSQAFDGDDEFVTSDFIGDAAVNEEEQQFVDQAVGSEFEATYDAAAADNFVGEFAADNTFAFNSDDEQFADQAFAADEEFAADNFAGDNFAADNFAGDNFAADNSFALGAEEDFAGDNFAADNFAGDNFAADSFVDQAVGDQFDAQFDEEFEAQFNDASFDQPL